MKAFVHDMQRIVAATAVLATLAGCGGVYDSSVTGLVTFDGQPLPRGTVAFMPQGGGPPGYGLIDGAGKYAIRTGREEGLPAGPYAVTVAANEAPPPVKPGGGPPPMGKPITPLWYRDPAQSGLSFEVKPGDQEINLELKSTPPPGWKPPRGR